MSRSLGNALEGMAVQYLQEHGAVVLERNYAARGGEIDIICSVGDTLVFVEVKGRMTPNGPDAAEEITPSKQRKICRAALYYLHTHGGTDRMIRFDALLIRFGEVEWIRNAFEYVG